MQIVTHKRPGGKLLRLKTTVQDEKMQSPQLSGDFFLMPPEGIEKLEEALDGFAITDAQALSETLTYVIQRDNIKLSGITVDDIVHAVGELQ